MPAKPGSTFATSGALLVPGGAKLRAPSDIVPPDPGDLLRPRAGPEEAPGESTSAGASGSPGCYSISRRLGGGILEVLKIAKYQLLDPCGPLGTPKPPPGSYFRIVRHLISDSVWGGWVVVGVGWWRWWGGRGGRGGGGGGWPRPIFFLIWPFILIGTFLQG